VPSKVKKGGKRKGTSNPTFPQDKTFGQPVVRIHKEVFAKNKGGGGNTLRKRKTAPVGGADERAGRRKKMGEGDLLKTLRNKKE